MSPFRRLGAKPVVYIDAKALLKVLDKAPEAALMALR